MNDIKGATTVDGLWKMNTMTKSNISRSSDDAKYKCTVAYSASGSFKGGSADSKWWKVNVIGTEVEIIPV